MRIYQLYVLLSILALNYSMVSGQSKDINFIDYQINDAEEECTIGCALGSSTSDGRPLLWKTRDWSVAPDNEVKYNTSFKYKFISLSTAGESTYAWIGVNEHGFAILNSHCTDLPAGEVGPSGGALMRDVLGNCLTIDEFQSYLDSTNITGRRTRDNFAVIDSTGGAAIFETSDSIYWKFDAQDSPNGYVIRTNFTINGGGSGGLDRYTRSEEIISKLYFDDNLNYRTIIRDQMRDFSDSNSNPVPIPFQGYWMPDIPYGYIYCNNSICRQNSVSAAVIHGVLPDELAGFSTMWTLLGHPATTIALPYWPLGETPIEADGYETSALCDQSLDIRALIFDSINVDYINSFMLKDNLGGGLWPCTFSLEDEIFEETDVFIGGLRSSDNIPIGLILEKESDLAGYALSQLENCYKSIRVGINNNESIKVYPNPFADEINISYLLHKNSSVRIDIVSYTGQIMETIVNGYQGEGYYSYSLNTSDYSYSYGVYIMRVFIDDQVYSSKLLHFGSAQ